MNPNLPHYQKTEKPWGNFERFALNEPATVKILTINPGEQFSLQKHHNRKEYWRILSGSGTIIINGEEIPAQANDNFFIEENKEHRAKAGPEGLKLLEISFGEFSEDDIERLADDYGRV